MKFLAFLSLSSTSWASLPPAWEGVRELKSILDDKSLNQYLDSSDIIYSIQRIEKGWMITTSHSQIEVEVNPLPQVQPGPEKFELKFKLSQSESGNVLR